MSGDDLWLGEIDASDDEEFRRFYLAAKEADGYQRPYAAFWPLEMLRASFLSATNPYEMHALAAIHHGEVIGTSQIGFPVLDNTTMANLELGVRPSFRGRGVGAALLEQTLRLVRDRGRSVVVSEVHGPFDGPSHGEDFLAEHGFTAGLLEIHRVLDLPLNDDRLASLAAAAAPHHRDYRIVTFGDTVPEEYVEGFCSLNARFNVEAPSGDLELEAEVWDADRVRAGEQRNREQGRRSVSTMALAPGGAPVALTVAGTSEAAPEMGWQAITLVVKEHRGHRLGLAVKVANLEAYRRRFPEVRLMHSWNAEENGPMVAINDALGFRPVERLVEMQLKL
jgi:GNAT superfamily N-acetyltransferase